MQGNCISLNGCKENRRDHNTAIFTRNNFPFLLYSVYHFYQKSKDEAEGFFSFVKAFSTRRVFCVLKNKTRVPVVWAKNEDNVHVRIIQTQLNSSGKLRRNKREWSISGSLVDWSKGRWKKIVMKKVQNNPLVKDKLFARWEDFQLFRTKKILNKHASIIKKRGFEESKGRRNRGCFKMVPRTQFKMASGNLRKGNVFAFNLSWRNPTRR